MEDQSKCKGPSDVIQLMQISERLLSYTVFATPGTLKVSFKLSSGHLPKLNIIILMNKFFLKDW